MLKSICTMNNAHTVNIEHCCSQNHKLSSQNSSICLESAPSFLKSEFRNSIFFGCTLIRFMVRGIFFSASSGIFRNSAAALYSSENGATSSASPVTYIPFSLPKPSYLSKIARQTFLFFSSAANFSPPSENIQNAP